jgi:hypothetical protein
MRHFLLSIIILFIIILFIIGCKQKQPNVQQSAPALSEIQLLSKQIIMDYYHHNNTWPDSIGKLTSFYNDNSANYPADVNNICQSLKLRSLQNGCLYVVTHMDVNECEPMVKVLANRIDPCNVKNLTWKTSMILSPSGQIVDESGLDEQILKEIKENNNNIIDEPISVTIIKN